MVTERPEWPHTIDDIFKSLDGVWGLVGATAVNGNLVRLERSLQPPVEYTFIEYEGSNESRVLRRQTYQSEEKEKAVNAFARLLGFTDMNPR